MLQTRINNLRKILKEKDLNGFLVSNFYNLLYLTGFRTLTDNEREAWGLVTHKNIYLFTDARYMSFPRRRESREMDPPIKSEDDNVKYRLITPEKGLINYLQDIVKEEEIKRLGFEGDDLKFNELMNIKDYVPNLELVSLERFIIKIREIKDEKEINNLKTVCKIADQCLEDVVKIIKPGVSEKEIAFKIEFWLKENGYDISFYPIVAVDKNSAVPHYDTRNGNNEKVKKNSIILIDYGAKFDDYHSDTTRMIFTGKPTQEMTDTYQALLNAQKKTIKQLESDNNPVSLDQFCRQQLSDVNQQLTYSHSTGHGVGLQIHEYPKISFTSVDVLLPGQVVTVEPGVYFNGKWGMRIEDTVLIKENKKVEVLTKLDKKLRIISNY